MIDDMMMYVFFLLLLKTCYCNTQAEVLPLFDFGKDFWFLNQFWNDDNDNSSI